MANPQYVTLVADTETRIDLDQRYGAVEISIISDPDLTCCNTRDVAITTVAGGPVDGHHALTATLPAKIVAAADLGGASVVRLRSTGTPTIGVYGL